MSLAEGTGTNDAAAASAPQEDDIEAKVQASVELAPPYQQPVTQVVVVPNNVQQTVNAATYTTGNQRAGNVTGIAVAGSVMVNNNLNYFRPRAEDTGDYQENMKPWETDGQNYSFACCTEKIAHTTQYTKKQSVAVQVDWIHSVYHKTGSTRLIVKRKAGSSALAQAKNNPATKWAVLLCLCAIVCFIFGGIVAGNLGDDDSDSDSYSNRTWNSATGQYDYDTDTDSEEDGSGGLGALFGGGAVLLLTAIILFQCYSKRRVMQTNFDLVTQSIPIASIFFVERTVEQTEEADQCCCEKPEEKQVHHTDISIGYNRSNLSTKLNGSASTEDYITFSLDSNQAYNLHQYINCIIDGSHPQFNGNVAIGAGSPQQDFLPRTSTFTPAV
eukprot:51576_1